MQSQKIRNRLKALWSPSDMGCFNHKEIVDTAKRNSVAQVRGPIPTFLLARTYNSIDFLHTWNKDARDQ